MNKFVLSLTCVVQYVEDIDERVAILIGQLACCFGQWPFANLFGEATEKIFGFQYAWITPQRNKLTKPINTPFGQKTAKSASIHGSRWGGK